MVKPKKLHVAPRWLIIVSNDKKGDEKNIEATTLEYNLLNHGNKEASFEARRHTNNKGIVPHNPFT